MTINIKPRHFIIFGLLIALGTTGYFFRNTISGLFTNGAQKKVDQALIYLKNSKTDDASAGLTLFSRSYIINILSNYSYYKIDEWKLNSKSIDNGKYKVEVTGIATNAFGAKLERTPTFIVEKQNGKWVIIDSYDFCVIDKMKDVFEKSDMEKHKMMEDMKNKVKIENWSYSSSGYGGSIEGHATIVNSSDVSVSFVKLVVEYYDKSGNIVNTDETYAVGGDDLQPGQKRKFDWYTSNCYDCNTATVHLKFD